MADELVPTPPDGQILIYKDGGLNFHPTSDLDQVIDEVKRLEAPPPPAPKEAGRKNKGSA